MRNFVLILTLLAACITASPVSSLAQAPTDVSAPIATTIDEPVGTSAAALGLSDLTDDLSRTELFSEIEVAYARSDPQGADEAVQYFNLWGPFRFPNDVDFDSVLHKNREDSLFGVDISHYTSVNFPIEQLSSRKVRFVYIKATQGTGSLDGKFANFWSRAGNLPVGSQIHRGAYHFLSSGSPNVPAAQWGRAQAETFIKVVRANGGLRATDMPPVVDLEWDKASKDAPDRWALRKPAEILAMLDAYLTTVKAALQRTPVIYTARAWWHERMDSEAQFAVLAQYPLWLADYSKTSRASAILAT